MTLNFQLSPEIKAKLLEKAALTGEAPEQLVVRSVENQFGDTPKKKKLSTEEWIKWLRSLGSESSVRRPLG